MRKGDEDAVKEFLEDEYSIDEEESVSEESASRPPPLRKAQDRDDYSSLSDSLSSIDTELLAGYGSETEESSVERKSRRSSEGSKETAR